MSLKSLGVNGVIETNRTHLQAMSFPQSFGVNKLLVNRPTCTHFSGTFISEMLLFQTFCRT